MLECLPRLQRLNQHEKLVVVLPFTLVFVGDGDGVFLLFSIVLNLHAYEIKDTLFRLGW